MDESNGPDAAGRGEGLPEPVHGGRQCPWPCLRSTPVEATFFKLAPNTTHAPAITFDGGGTGLLEMTPLQNHSRL
jgi:hypothetical protein